MQESTQKYLAEWHLHCSSTKYRSDFIVPHICRVAKSFDCSAITFLGSSTGYIPSAVDKALNGSVSISLIEKSLEALNFSKTQPFISDKVSYIHSSIEDVPASAIRSDILVLSNVLLDVELDEKLANAIVKLVNENAVLLVFMPDTLRDVLFSDRYDVTMREQYTNGIVSLSKVSNNGVVYPFVAQRPLYWISLILSEGLKLRNVQTWSQEHRAFCLEFVR